MKNTLFEHLRKCLKPFLVNFTQVLVIIAAIHCKATYAQEVNQIIKDNLSIQPPSPEAAALGKYVDFPQVASSGVTPISIPLYELKSGRLKLPISLSYHASGIRVGQHSTWAGLGWSLNAGGVIVREVKDVPDDYKMRDFNPFISDRNVGSIGWLFDLSGRVRVNSPSFPFISEDPFDYQWCSCEDTEGEQMIDLCRKLNGEFRGMNYPSLCPDMDKCINSYPFYNYEYSCDEYDAYVQVQDHTHKVVVFYAYDQGYNNSVGGFNDASNKYDSEPDVFTVNAADLSFKFVFDKDGNPKVINSSKNIKIEPVFVELDEGEYIYGNVFTVNTIKILDSYLSGFIITDDDGTIYTFDKMEITTTSTTKDLFQFDGRLDCDLVVVPNEDNYHPDFTDKSAVSTAWYLSKIENRYGDEIVFTYDNNPDAEELYLQPVTEYKNLYYSGLSSSYFFLIANDPKSINISVDKFWLSNISGKDVSIDIHTFSSNEEKTNGQYLDNIVINNSSGRIKKYDFTINPVTSPYVNYLSPEEDQARYRYYLDKIQEYGKTDASVKPAYTFSYHSRNLLPNKFSKEQDYWGYYNDNGNDIEPDGGSLIPKLYVYPQQSEENRYSCWPLSGMGTEVVLGGANRSVNADRCYCGTLSQITYPTGGKTIYAYEPNTFYDENAVYKTQYGPGIRVKSIKKYDSDNKLVLQKSYSYNQENDASKSSGILVRKPIFANPKTYYSDDPAGVILQANTNCNVPREYEHCLRNRDLTDYPVPVSTSVYSSGLGRNYTSDEIEDYWIKYTERSSLSYSPTTELEGISLSYTNVVEDNMGNGETHYAYYSPMSYKNPNVSPYVQTSDFAWTFHKVRDEEGVFLYIENIAPKPDELQVWGPIEKTGRNIFPHPQFTETDHNLFTKPISVSVYNEDRDLVSISTNSYSTIEKPESSKVYGLVHRKHNTFNSHVISENTLTYDPVTGSSSYWTIPRFSAHFNDVPYAYARYGYHIGRETLPNKKFSASNFTLVASTDFDGNSFGNLDYNSSKVVSLLGSNALQLGSSSEVIVNGLSKGSYMVSFTADIKPGETVIVNNSVIPENSFYGENTYREANIFIDLESTNSIRIFTTDEEEIIDNIKIYKCIYLKTDYKYNSELKLSEKITYNSNDDVFKTIYQYPYDFCGEVFKEMVDKNIVDEPVLLKETNNDNLLSFSYTNYTVQQNDAIVPSINYTFNGTPPVSFPLWQSNQANLYYEEILLIGDYGNQGLNIYSINNTARGSKLELNLEHIDQGDMVTIYLYNVTRDKAEMIYMNHPDYSKSVEVKLEDYCEYNVKIHSMGRINVTGYINVSYPSCYFMSNSPYIRRNVSFDSYNQNGDLLQYHKENDIDVSYIWGYNNTYPIAKIANAEHAEVRFDNYEDEENPKGFRNTYDHYLRSNTMAHSGEYSWKTTSHKTYKTIITEIDTTNLNTDSKYVFSVWIKCDEIESGGYINISLKAFNSSGQSVDETVNYDATRLGEWQLLKAKVDLAEALTSLGTITNVKCYIKNYGPGSLELPAYYDDVRFCPADAQMTTYTYDPLVGVTSVSDNFGRVTKYDYDDFNRLEEIRDNEDFIMEKYHYHYAE